MSKILLTGGSGFVGSSLIKKLKKNFNILSADLYNNNFLNKNEQFILDLSEDSSFDVLKKEKFNICIHTAGIFKNKKDILKTSEMDDKIINFCEIENIKLIYFSTFLINITPNSEYSKLKLNGEKKIKKKKIPHIIIRPETIYNVYEKKIKFYKKFKIFNSTISFPRKNVYRSPSHINDLEKLLKIVLNQEKFTNKIYDFGGPRITYEDMLKKCNNNKLNVYNTPYLIKLFLKVILNLKFGKSIIDSQELDRIVNSIEIEKDFGLKLREFSLNE